MMTNQKQNNMKKLYVFVGNTVLIQTEQKLQLLVKSKRGAWLAEDENHCLYSNNIKMLKEDLGAEDFTKDLRGFALAMDYLSLMTKKGVKKI